MQFLLYHGRETRYRYCTNRLHCRTHYTRKKKEWLADVLGRLPHIYSMHFNNRAKEIQLQVEKDNIAL